MGVAYGIAGHPHEEELIVSGIEKNLRGNARIRTRQNLRKWGLASTPGALIG